MMKRDLYLMIVWVMLIVAASCARKGMPTGGARDTIPPTIVKMDPAIGTVNFKGDKLEIEFTEYIQARDLKKELIVNPKIDDYKFYTSKRTLVINLEEGLQDSTTYTFNFREAVKDISEGNSAENAILAFSTGSYLDSFQVIGNVKMLLTQKPAEDVVVGLYSTTDTSNIFNSPPLYFTKTDENGNYLINYIKEGVYQIYAFDDQNNNLEFESNNEAIGFKIKPIYLTMDSVQEKNRPDSLIQNDSIGEELKLYGEKVDLVLIKKDIRPIIIQSNRSNGKYYEIKFNKSLKSYRLTVEEDDLTPATKAYVEDSIKTNVQDSVPKYLYSNFQEQQQLIRIYNTIRQDSLRIFLTGQDSAKQQIEDTVLYIKFAESRRKAEELTQQFVPEQSEISRRIEGEISFSKPIISINTDSILLVYDTLFTIPIDYNSFFSWNEHYDKVSIRKEIKKEELISQIILNKRKSDSLEFIKKVELEQQYIDSLEGTNNSEDQLKYLEALANLQKDRVKLSLLDSIKTLDNGNNKNRWIANFADTITVDTQYKPVSYSRENLLTDLQPLVLYMAPGSFMSVEQDSSKEVRQIFTFKDANNYGTVKGKIKTEYPSYFIQLIDKDFNVIAETNSRNNYSFQLIPPGMYKIRVLIDHNENGQWEEGNLLENQEPEPIIVYDHHEINLKANWEYDLDLEF